MFSATAIIRCPRTSRNSRVDCATDTAATATQHDTDHQQLEHQELARQAAEATNERRLHLFKTTNTSFASVSVTWVTVGVQYC